ncbi:MAG: hypothetical protein JWO53_27 [Chlamydiia bacterium]|nr:hypothetical protein [Chlamydiia bacterium]
MSTVQKNEPPSPHTVFLHKLLQNTTLGMLLLLLSLALGICGYHYIEDFEWIDAYLEASMILSGMGSSTPVHTTAGKIFSGVYALYSGCALLFIVGIMLAPVVHRFLHKLHVELDVKNDSKKQSSNRK